MSRMDIVSDNLNKITMYEKLGKDKALLEYSNKVFLNIVKKLNDLEYIKDYSITKTNRGDKILINLHSKINQVRSISPRMSVRNDEYEKFEKRYLPARNFGYLIISTSQGVMTHEEAKKKQIGGVLLAYVY